ncbi:putative ATP-dependent helicase/translocase YwqA [Saccoglossus kowalevskii]
MVKNTYGKTAWGKAFLDAMGRIDMNARLGRGKSYANTGKVVKITINGSQVKAKVMGQMIYTVDVLYENFKQAKKNIVYSLIEQNPLLYGHIINGELPAELIGMIEEAKVNLFPQRWSDMKAKCSCPDFGNPCKHMAAVYFLITSEIDKNPFTLFTLHGMDLVKHFNIKVSETEPGYPLPIHPAKHVKDEIDETDGEFDHMNELKKCELLKIPSLSGFILDCLSSNPPFSSQLDYKEVMQEFYSFTAKKGREMLMRLSGAGSKEEGWLSELDLDDVHRVLSQSEFRLSLDDKFNSRSVWIHNELWDEDLNPNQLFQSMPFTTEMLQEDGCKWVKLDILIAIQLLFHISNDFGSSSYHYFFYASRVALQIMSGQAFVPDVLPLTTHGDEKIANFKIIWKPLFTCSTVEEQLNKLANLYPGKPCVNVGKKDLDGKSAGLHFMSVVFTRYVRDLGFMHKKLKNSPPKESLAFFHGNIFQVLSLAEKSIPKSIAKYFGVFDLMKTDFEVSVHVNQLAGNISIKQEYDDVDLGMSLIDEYQMGLWLKPKKVDRAESLPVRTYMKRYPNTRNQVLKFLSTLVPYLNQVERLMISDAVPMSSDDLESFILETIRIFTNLGVKVVLPKELMKVLKPRAVIHAESKDSLSGASHQSFFTLDQMLSYDWKIAIGDEVISVAEFQKMVQAGNKLVKFKDKYVSISPEEMRNILSSVQKQIPKMSALDLLKESLVVDSPFHLSSDVEGFLKRLIRVSDFPVPAELNATLRKYQVNGFKWMVSNLLNGFGVILADDMGLGKTIQTITTILHLKLTGQLVKPVLLVVPTSVMSNWEREVKRFAPCLTVEKYYGTGRALPIDSMDGYDSTEPVRKRRKTSSNGSDIIMTTYQLLWRDVEVLQKMKFGMIVIDEAQHIKNFKSQTSKCLKKIKSPMRVALSGTPVENKLSELWSVFDFAIPKYLGTIKDFSDNLAKPIEIERDPEKLCILKSITAPFLMRRLKTDKNIIKDLPDKVIDNKYVSLSTEQAALYESLVREMMQKIIECKEKGQRNKYIFKILTHLKQICNHPANYLDSKPSIVEHSGKMKMLVELLEPILQQGEKVLIFSQYVRMISLMAKMLEHHFHIKPLTLEGSMSQIKRDKVIHAFKTEPHQQVFIISLKAGGTGLNLTEANHVIHYDLWYNPAVENQATDRAYRIGQSKSVFVYRMITEKTFEERIDEMIVKKKDLSDLSVNVGEQWIGSMSNDDLRALFSRG